VEVKMREIRIGWARAINRGEWRKLLKENKTL
jgi:hypothetical protein